MTKNNFLKGFNSLQIKQQKKVTCEFTYIWKVGNTKSHKNSVKNNSSLDIQY